MNIDLNKVYLSFEAHRIPALHYSLAAFDKNEYVDEIVMVVRRDDRDLVCGVILHDKFPRKPVWIALGGEKRSDSVYNALEKVRGDIVLVHDGARPLLKQRYITDCVEAMDRTPGAVIAIKCTDTVYTVGGDGLLLDRGDPCALYQAQTPQCFHTDILKRCHEEITDKSKITDDSSLLELSGYEVTVLPGEYSNIKLTTPLDICLAEQYIKNDGEILGLFL